MEFLQFCDIKNKPRKNPKKISYDIFHFCNMFLISHLNFTRFLANDPNFLITLKKVSHKLFAHSRISSFFVSILKSHLKVFYFRSLCYSISSYISFAITWISLYANIFIGEMNNRIRSILLRVNKSAFVLLRMWGGCSDIIKRSKRTGFKAKCHVFEI